MTKASIKKATGKQKLTVKAHRGDAKTLLAFNLPKGASDDLAGFTIRCEPKGQPAYFLHNTLQFATPGKHAQVAQEAAHSSVNAPFQRFRWLHVPGSVHQGTEPFFGPYTYTVTPRYFDARGSMLPMDPAQSVSVSIEVGPLVAKRLKVGFTRGYTQSQAFVDHFGLKAKIRPDGNELLFDTSQIAGQNAHGEKFTFADAYAWLGYTARARIFELLDEVAADRSLSLDVFAYDLNEPDFAKALLALAKQGRVSIILDNAALHQTDKKTGKASFEDAFEKEFRRVAKKPAAILRGKFGRYSHDKVLIVSQKSGKRPVKVLSGSTNFSVTGLYVNSNHVLVFDDAAVAAKYKEVFDFAWSTGAKKAAFAASELAAEPVAFASAATPRTSVAFSPHDEQTAEGILQGLVDRIEQEGKTSGGSVLFAVMQLDRSSGPVLPTLSALHEQQNIFSFGISDTTSGISLYEPGRRRGVLVTGKPSGVRLPPPFNQVREIAGVGHQIHHKFVVCGFNGKNPVVYCGSSNLALGGEENNGDNLIAIHDADVASAFAIDALALVDHFQFLNRRAGNGAKKAKPAKSPTDKRQAAIDAGWFLFTDSHWVSPYFDPKDLHCTDRTLFA